uniref:C-type lectin domain-containing protein n=1 Tax=Anabas testudineus TaxID=64144 RepID=A0A7N6FJM3_ANATE
QVPKAQGGDFTGLLFSVWGLRGATAIKADLQASNNNMSSLMQERDQLKTNLTEMTKGRDQLKTSLTEMTKGRDQLKTSLTEMTEERDQLKTSLTVMTKERDHLKTNLNEMTKENNKLLSLYKKSEFACFTLNLFFVTDSPCPTGWNIFRCSCYFLYEGSGSWTKGRQDCRDRGADLVVIDSDEEQSFLSEFTNMNTWIGLSDRDKEGTWKWVDGTPLTVKYWSAPQPDNGNGDPQFGEEDCVHIREAGTSSWNDLSCEASLPWVCEKSHAQKNKETAY